MDDNCRIYIGKGSTFEKTTIAMADNNNKVVIGEDCMFARDTKILASDFHSIIDLETGIRKNKSKGVIIDNHVWIGFGAIVLKNAHIMSNSIVGANAVACGIISPNSIFRKDGNMCKFKKHEVTWERSRNIQFSPVAKKVIRIRKRYKTNCDMIFNIENDISCCMNKIQGWAFLQNVDSKESMIYIRFTEKYKIVKEMVLPLKITERTDVAEAYKEEKYKYCGFFTYMPAEVILNHKKYENIELIVQNGNKCGRVKLF